MSQYKGKGFIQITGRMAGKNSMATSPIQISSLNNVTAVGQVLSAGASGPMWKNVAMNANTGATFSFEDLKSTHEYLRKYEMYESRECVIALSCASHRLLQETKVYYSITERDLYNKITPEDRILSDHIKQYYSKKVMMWKLKNDGKLTPFREDMNKLIHSDGTVFKESMIGVAYYLPIFYQYDIEMDMIKIEVTKDQGFVKMDQDNKPRVLKLEETITPIKKLLRKTKRTAQHEYWFKSDNEHNAALVININDKNELMPLWNRIFNKKEPMKISGNYIRRRLDDFEYYSITNWDIVDS
jgi:hypothetical protein